MLKKLIAADGEGNWEAHFKENQRLIINKHYGSIYLEFMRKLPKEYL